MVSQNYFSSFDFNFLPYTLKAIYQHPLSHFTVDKQYLHHYRTIRILPSRIVHASRLLESPAPSSSPLSQARASRPTSPPLPLTFPLLHSAAPPSPSQRRRLSLSPTAAAAPKPERPALHLFPTNGMQSAVLLTHNGGGG